MTTIHQIYFLAGVDLAGRAGYAPETRRLESGHPFPDFSTIGAFGHLDRMIDYVDRTSD